MRDMVFLSHANPEDNAITQWLALQLAREGYPVWCDLTKLLGGEDFWEDIERAIRERTVKFLYVLSRVSNHKPGSLKELDVAGKIQRKEDLKDFIVPLWIDDLPSSDFNIQLGRLNAIRFQDGWAKGLAQLLKKLEEDGVAKRPGFGPAAVTNWWREHVSASSGIRNEPEPVVSNWYPIEPATLYFHELTRSGLGPLETPAKLPYPGVRHNQYLLSFACAEAFKEQLGPGVSVRSTVQRTLNSAGLEGGPIQWTIAEQRAALSTLMRQAWLALIARRDLPQYVLADNAVAFYFKKDQLPDDRAWFTRIDASRSYRGVVGYKTVRGRIRYWHFALRGKPATTPVVGYAMKPHVVFSDDGSEIWTSKQALHRARRSQCKDWWNDRWRDLISGAVTWLAQGDSAIALPVGPDETLRITATPLHFESPMSFNDPVGATGEEIPGEQEEDDDEAEDTEELDNDEPETE